MNIGFIGLGLMGESMALNILKKLECTLYVFDLEKDKVKKLEKDGAIACLDAKELTKRSDVVITMVPKKEHIIAVHKSLYEAVKPNQLFIDMSSIDPNVSKTLASKMETLGARMIDAPVVKSKPAAIDGTLGIYVGGDKDDYNEALPILNCMGSNVIYMGENGTGVTMKILHNMLVGQIQNGVNEMIVLSEKANIDITDFMKAISYGGGQNFYLDGKGAKISNRNFTTAFSIENMHKDVHLAKDLADSYNLNLSGVNTVVDVYDKAIESGYNNEDFSASFKVVESRSDKNEKN